MTESRFDRVGEFGATATRNPCDTLLDTTVWVKDVLDLFHSPPLIPRVSFCNSEVKLVVMFSQVLIRVKVRKSEESTVVSAPWCIDCSLPQDSVRGIKIEAVEQEARLPALTRLQLLIMLAVTALVLLVIAQVWRSLAGIELAFAFTWTALAEGAVLAGLISLASLGIFWLWPAYRESALQYMRSVLAPLQPFDWFWLGLLPGLSEELLFRGVILPSLGLVASSLIFGALHVYDWKQWPYAAWTTCVGFALGTATLLTGNLLVAVVAHVLVNWLSCAIWRGQMRQA